MRRLLLLAALVAITGCGGKKRAVPRAERDAAVEPGPTIHDLTPTAARVPFAEPTVALPRELRATLVEPGAAPRTVRRYAPSAETRELRVAMTVTASGFHDGVWSQPQTLPVMTDGFGITVDATAPIALRGLVAEIADGGAHVEAEAYLGRWRALLERRRVAVATDGRGTLGAITLQDDPTSTATRDELVQRWLGLAVPLPVEAIGVGARWRVVTILRTGGAVVKQTATYQLTAVDGAAATVAVELTRIGEQQLIEVPGLPADVTAELVALRRVVKGTLVLGPGSPLPLRGTLTSESSAHARFTSSTRAAVDEVSDDSATIVLTSK